MTLNITMLCRYAKSHYTECRIVFIIMLNVIMLGVVKLSVVVPPGKTVFIEPFFNIDDVYSTEAKYWIGLLLIGADQLG